MKTRIAAAIVFAAIFAVVIANCSGSMAAYSDEQTSSEKSSDLFPPIQPNKSGFLKVSDMHTIYWETSGNPEGIPVIGLHGGPGGGSSPHMRQFFDPSIYRIVLYDQRGAGKSKPFASIEENNTQNLVADINNLREHLNIDGKMVLFGGSWGSTLAVAYAESFPENVSGIILRGVFLASDDEINHFYHGGVSPLYPEVFAKLQNVVPNPESKNYPRQLFEMTQSEDPEIRQRAIDGWAYYEIRMVSLDMTDKICQQIIDQYDMTPFSVLENYYMMNRCFLENNQLMENADKIAHIPTYIVNGRFDMICPPETAYRLAEKIENVKLELVRAAHSDREPEIARGLVRASNWMAEQLQN